MPLTPPIAAVRFGTGLSPVIAPPASAQAMMQALLGPDTSAAAWPIPRFAEAAPTAAAFRQMSRDRRAAVGTDREAEVEAAHDALRARAEALRLASFGATLARWIGTGDGLRERLVAFWSSHFTVRARSGTLRHLVTPYVEEAIRPHVAGRFGDLLVSAITHPMMLAYLDQTDSMGPNSQAALRRDRGLNENLARELLELHTVGVDGPYDQTDVRELAELLTGIGWDMDAGEVVYRPRQAEPGAETVLGTVYSDRADLSTVLALLSDLAVHPATARHVAGKLARHFVADEPPPDLVAALESRFLDTGGDLAQVTAALLDHPAAHDAAAAKVRPPFDFVAAALRALGAGPEVALLDDVQVSRRHFQLPMGVMGQPWETPGGPDGWPDDAASWITPQFMAARIDWAMRMPERILTDLPDPRDLARAALGTPPEDVVIAAAAAEDRRIGVGVVLASAAFQRR